MSEWGGGQAAYVRVAEDLRAKIESGELAPGATVPSVTTIQETYKVSNTTAQSAIKVLKAAGLVESQRGRGVYVRKVRLITSRSADYTSPPADGTTNYRAKSRNVEISEVVPPDDVAEKLGLNEGIRALRRSRLMVEEGEPVELVSSYFPVEIARGTELDDVKPIKGSTLSALKRLGYPPRHPAREWVQTRMPTAEEARKLDLPPGTPVLRLVRLTCTDGGQPIEVLDMVFGGNRYLLEYELPVHE